MTSALTLLLCTPLLFLPPEFCTGGGMELGVLLTDGTVSVSIPRRITPSGGCTPFTPLHNRLMREERLMERCAYTDGRGSGPWTVLPRALEVDLRPGAREECVNGE